MPSTRSSSAGTPGTPCEHADLVAGLQHGPRATRPRARRPLRLSVATTDDLPSHAGQVVVHQDDLHALSRWPCRAPALTAVARGGDRDALDALGDEVLDRGDHARVVGRALALREQRPPASGWASSHAFAAFSSVKKKSTGNLVTKPSFTTSPRCCGQRSGDVVAAVALAAQRPRRAGRGQGRRLPRVVSSTSFLQSRMPVRPSLAAQGRPQDGAGLEGRHAINVRSRVTSYDQGDDLVVAVRAEAATSPTTRPRRMHDGAVGDLDDVVQGVGDDDHRLALARGDERRGRARVATRGRRAPRSARRGSRPARRTRPRGRPRPPDAGRRTSARPTPVEVGQPDAAAGRGPRVSCAAISPAAQEAQPARQPGRPGKLPPGVEVLAGRQIVEEREILVDGLDPERPGVGRRVTGRRGARRARSTPRRADGRR